jgi:hypothetical protein
MSAELDHLDVGGHTAAHEQRASRDATRMATRAFVENEQRENLSVLDTAMAVSRMLDDRLYETVEAAAPAVGRSIPL